MTDTDSLNDFQEGQWWIATLDEMANSNDATSDQKRAVAVVHNMLRAARAQALAEYPPLPRPAWNAKTIRATEAAFSADQMRTYYGQGRIGRAPAPAAKCETCNDNGLIGGPSFYDPGEGGVPCPDCSAPAAVEPIFEGGRESVDDAIAVVESFGPGIEGLNDTFARQILLADEVKRLQRLYDSAVTGRADMRDALREARHGAQPVKLDFTKPLETDEGKPVKWIAADVIEHECARVCVDVNTGLVYSSPYVGLKIRNATEAPAAVEPVAYLHDDGYWTAAKTEQGRALSDRLHFAGSPKIGVHLHPAPAPNALDAETVKKAQRYDYLRDLSRHFSDCVDGAIYVRQIGATSGVITSSNILTERDLDTEIDAAIAAQETQGARP